MIVDSSAIMAVLLGEAEAERLMAVMVDAPGCSISAGTWIELAAVTVRRGYNLEAQIDALFVRARMRIIPVSVEQAEIGHAAYRTYGRGTEHRARLNFGDCFAYALARATGEPLLYKGDDFVHTDVVSALAD